MSIGLSHILALQILLVDWWFLHKDAIILHIHGQVARRSSSYDCLSFTSIPNNDIKNIIVYIQDF